MGIQSTTEDDWQAQLTDYVFGAMAPAEAAEFERKLEECRTHVALAREYSEVVGILGASIPPAEPPAGHKSRLMARIAATPQERPATVTQPDDVATLGAGANPVSLPLKPLAPAQPAPTSGATITDLGAYRERRNRTLALPIFAAAAAAIILLVGLWGFSLQQRLNETEAALATERSNLNVARATLNIPPGYVAFPVQGNGPQPDASAVVFFNPETNQASLLANGLQPLPAGKVYELWLLPPGFPDENPVAAGVFTVNERGQAQHKADAPSRLREYAGVAVTVEDDPGVKFPAGPIVLVGNYDLE
ncbi:MAG TPA: anti-sigma factor [Chloroflexia bacterium]|jgi:anti-sigma-K factor RskA